MKQHLYKPEQTKKPKLVSISRIKDAIPHIDRCLSRLSELVDEIIIVDNDSQPDMFQAYAKYPKIECFSTSYANEDEILDKLHTIDKTITIKEGIICTAGLDEPRDRRVMDLLYRERSADWVYFVDADEMLESKVTRAMIDEWMAQDEFNAILFRHVHHWNDENHYRVDQRWKARHNRMMWRVTPESHMIPHQRTNPNIVYNLKGKMLQTDFCVRHFGHIDKAENERRQALWRSIDNESHDDFTGMDYSHMTDTEFLELAEWHDNAQVRNFGNPSMLLIMLHGGGDCLMLTPALRQLKKTTPNLEISIMGLEKIDERDFKTHEIFQNNPNVKRYYPSSLPHHPTWWNQEVSEERDMPVIQKDVEEINQLTRFDQTILLTLQEKTGLHRIDRMAAQLGVELESRQMEIHLSKQDKKWASQVYLEMLAYGKSDCMKISVHRFCGHPPKSWDWDECRSLCEYLTKQGHVVILWDNDKREEKHEPEQIKMDGVINMRDYTDELTIGKSAALLELCDMHIGADSMPMHLANAVDIPTIGIFHKTRPHETAPMTDASLIIMTEQVKSAMPVPFYKEHRHRMITVAGEAVKFEHVIDAFENFRVIEYDIENMPQSKYEKSYPLNCAYDGSELYDYTDVVDPIADLFDQLPGLIHNPLKWFDYIRFMELLNDRTRIDNHMQSILDIGGGLSVFPFYLASLGYSVVSVDPDKESNQIRNKLALQVNKPDNGHLIIKDGTIFDYDNLGPFDMITCISVIEHVENDTETALEAAKYLKPGGIMAITCDFYTNYIPYPDANRTLVKDRKEHCDSRIYNADALYTRIIEPLQDAGLVLMGETNFDNIDIKKPVNRPVRGLYTFARMFFEKRIMPEDENPLRLPRNTSEEVDALIVPKSFEESRELCRKAMAQATDELIMGNAKEVQPVNKPIDQGDWKPFVTPGTLKFEQELHKQFKSTQEDMSEDPRELKPVGNLMSGVPMTIQHQLRKRFEEEIPDGCEIGRHFWIPLDASIEPMEIFVHCSECGQEGTINDPTADEWFQAHKAIETNTKWSWTDESRIIIESDDTEEEDEPSWDIRCDANEPWEILEALPKTLKKYGLRMIADMDNEDDIRFSVEPIQPHIPEIPTIRMDNEDWEKLCGAGAIAMVDHKAQPNELAQAIHRQLARFGIGLIEIDTSGDDYAYTVHPIQKESK